MEHAWGLPRGRRQGGRQLTVFPRGGARPGAGRKPRGPWALVSHAVRPRVTRHGPLLVTTRLLPGFPDLRRERTLATLLQTISAGADRFGLRLVEYSIQTNPLRVIAEAEDARSLARAAGTARAYGQGPEPGVGAQLLGASGHL